MSPDMTAVDVGVSDEDLFSGATAEEAPVEKPEAEPVVEGEQPRNPDGTFASKEAEKPEVVEAKPEAEQIKPAEVEDDKGGQIPSWRLREETEARRRLEADLATERAERTRVANEAAEMRRRVAALEKPEKPKEEPDPLLDPVGFREHMRREFQESLLNERRESSLRTAHRVHKEAFTEAYAEAQKAMAAGDQFLAARMNASADPGETLIEWHREQKTLREVGKDPATYKQRVLDEALKDPAYLAKALAAAKATANGSAQPQPGGTAPVVRLPPSLSGAARASQHTADPDDNDMSDEAIMRHALR